MREKNIKEEKDEDVQFLLFDDQLDSSLFKRNKTEKTLGGLLEDLTETVIQKLTSNKIRIDRGWLELLEDEVKKKKKKKKRSKKKRL